MRNPTLVAVPSHKPEFYVLFPDKMEITEYDRNNHVHAAILEDLESRFGKDVVPQNQRGLNNMLKSRKWLEKHRNSFVDNVDVDNDVDDNDDEQVAIDEVPSKCPQDPIIGWKIIDMFQMSSEQIRNLEEEFAIPINAYDSMTVIELSNGNQIFATQDVEFNGLGAFGYFKNGEVHPETVFSLYSDKVSPYEKNKSAKSTRATLSGMIEKMQAEIDGADE